MKIDCSNLLNFKREHERMCLSNTVSCTFCPFDKIAGNCSPVDLMLEDITKEMVEVLQKWSDEHQPKTLLEDFLEKYPNAKKRSVDGLPCFCPSLLGYKNVKICTSPQFEYGENCISCWNRLLEEVEEE